MANCVFDQMHSAFDQMCAFNQYVDVDSGPWKKGKIELTLIFFIEAFKLFKGLTDVPYTTFFQLATDSNTGGLPSLKNEDQQTLLQD